MHVYFSGIGGNGLGPLAEITKQAGYQVSGSDLAKNAMTQELTKQNIEVQIGQDGSEIAAVHVKSPIDWLVISSSIPVDHPEIAFAKQHGIRITKRGPLLQHIITESNLQLIAVAGTHGKTTTTAMLVWLFQQLGQTPSYSIGSNINFGPSGYFSNKSNYFIYEADEHDRNMLDFTPVITIIPSLDYDHPNTYPTVEDYKQAFRDFIQQSERIYLRRNTFDYLGLLPSEKINIVNDTILPAEITLPGKHIKDNARLAILCTHNIFKEAPFQQIIAAVNSFPGTRRRFEKLAPNIYTDYAHHPAEIKATLQLARELNDHVTVVYQPHQNIRQHEIINDYKDCFDQAEHVYWLPTYLTREAPSLSILTPQELITHLHHPEIAEPAEMDANLQQRITEAAANGKLVLFMGAGTIDDWARTIIPL